MKVLLCWYAIGQVTGELAVQQDPVLAGHMRAILDELFAALQSRAAGATGVETATLRLVIHVVNSLRMQCR